MVEDEARSVLARSEYFVRGPLAFRSEFGGAAWRGIHGSRRKLLIGIGGGETRIAFRRDDRLTALAVPLYKRLCNRGRASFG